jgi:hypothetical protein
MKRIFEIAIQRLLRSGYPNLYVYCQDSRIFLQGTDLTFDFAFFDSECEIRVEESQNFLERGILKE